MTSGVRHCPVASDLTDVVSARKSYLASLVFLACFCFISDNHGENLQDMQEWHWPAMNGWHTIQGICKKYLKVKKDKVQDSISLCHATQIRCLGDWSAGENPCDDLRKGRGCCVTHCEWHAAGDHGDWLRLSDHVSHVFTRKFSIGGCVNKQHALQYRIS